MSETLPPRFVRKRVQWRRYALAAGWMLVGLLIGALAGWELRESRPSLAAADAGAGMARRAAIAHATYSPEVRHPVEVGADQEAHLVAWLSKRLGAPLRAPQLDEVGYSLVGGRLPSGRHRPGRALHVSDAEGRAHHAVCAHRGRRQSRDRVPLREEGKCACSTGFDRKMAYAFRPATSARTSS
jgi:anti-sigma factor RsiW